MLLIEVDGILLYLIGGLGTDPIQVIILRRGFKMKYVMAIKICFAIEQRLNFNSTQSYSIERVPDRDEDEDAWLVKITFKDSTDYWVIENLTKTIKSIAQEIHIKIIWEKRQLLLDVTYYGEKITESLDKELKGLQLDDSEHKEQEEIGH